MKEEMISIKVAAELMRFEEKLRLMDDNQRTTLLRRLEKNRPNFYQAYLHFHSGQDASRGPSWHEKASEGYLRAWAAEMSTVSDESLPARLSA